MKKSRLIIWLLLAGVFMLGSACTLTPHANVGLNLDYYGGEFHVRPSAEIGIHGRP